MILFSRIPVIVVKKTQNYHEPPYQSFVGSCWWRHWAYPDIGRSLFPARSSSHLLDQHTPTKGITSMSFTQISIYPQLHLNHAWKWHWELLVQRRKTRHLGRFLIESYWFLLPQNLNLHVYHNWLEEKWNSTPLAPSPGPLPPAPEDGRDPVRLVGLEKILILTSNQGNEIFLAAKICLKCNLLIGI